MRLARSPDFRRPAIAVHDYGDARRLSEWGALQFEVLDFGTIKYPDITLPAQYPSDQRLFPDQIMELQWLTQRFGWTSPRSSSRMDNIAERCCRLSCI